MTTQALAGNSTEFHSGMHNPGRDYTDTVLAARRMLALPDENLRLICLSGELWLTRDGDSEDYILGPGQSFSVRPGDQAAVQALQASRIRLLTV